MKTIALDVGCPRSLRATKQSAFRIIIPLFVRIAKLRCFIINPSETNASVQARNEQKRDGFLNSAPEDIALLTSSEHIHTYVHVYIYFFFKRMNGIRLNESNKSDYFSMCVSTHGDTPSHTTMHVVCRQASCNKYRARSRDPLFRISPLKCVRRLFCDLSTGSQSGYFAEHYLKLLITL